LGVSAVAVAHLEIIDAGIEPHTPKVVGPSSKRSSR
jgi:hypothetical protein